MANRLCSIALALKASTQIQLNSFKETATHVKGREKRNIGQTGKREMEKEMIRGADIMYSAQDKKTGKVKSREGKF